MKVTVLASGSKGNCTLVETPNHKILIDVGLTYRKLSNRLSEVGVSIDQIDAIFITHEHTDHIKGLQVLIKRHDIHIVLSHGSYEAIVSKKKIGIMYEHFNVIDAKEEIFLSDMKVVPFHVSHDAMEPFGYVFYEGEKKLVYLTDSGFVSEKIEEMIMGADLYIMETNHNVELLMSTNRPWYLKQRILGDEGHLCNEDALNTLLRVVNDKTKAIYLAHISEEANNVDLLLLTVNEIFSSCVHNERIQFHVAKQYEISEISEI